MKLVTQSNLLSVFGKGVFFFAAAFADKPALSTETIRVETSYDARGQVLRKSQPRKSGDALLWTEYRHDSLDRQIRLTYPDGSSVTTKYLPGDRFGVVETIDEIGHKHASHFDAFGNEIYRDRYDQTQRLRTSYSYDVLNRLLDIRDAKGSLYWYAYDGHGNRIFDADPNLGCREMAYDAGNRLKEKRSASGALVSFSYDVLNRITAKTANKDALQFSDCSFPIISGSKTEVGGSGNDTLDAGEGRLSNVTLSGSAGDDTYIIRARSGHVIIPTAAEGANGGTDTIRFVDLVLADMTISDVVDPQGGEFLQFSWEKYGGIGSLKVAQSADHMEQFEFADGVTLSNIYIEDIGRLVLGGTLGDDYIKGGGLTDGGPSGRFGDDYRISGGAGNDTLETGPSDFGDWQIVQGYSGNDTYLIGSDSGLLLLDHNGEKEGGGTDTIRFKDLSLSDMTISYHDHGNSNGIALKFAWEAAGNRPAGHFHIANKAEHIERFEFADGVTLSNIYIEDIGRLVLGGTLGDDYIKGGGLTDGGPSGRFGDDYRISGGAGNDTLETGLSDFGDWQIVQGYSGNDTYLIGSDSGLLLLDHNGEKEGGGTDTIRFKDLSLSDMTISYHDHGNSNGIALKFAWEAAGNRPAGHFHIANKAEHIERFEFADGVTLSNIYIEDIGRLVLGGTLGDDYIRGGGLTDGGPSGRFGDDYRISGGAGNDTLETGPSDFGDWQIVQGYSGNDTYLIGSDSGLLLLDHNGEKEGGGTDTIRFKDLSLSDMTISYHDHGNSNGIALKFAWEAAGNRPAGHFHIANKAEHIERFEFADGSVRTAGELQP